MASIKVEIAGLDRLERRLSELARDAGDLSPLMRDIGESLLNSTRHRFETETDPDGNAWAPLAPATVARKKRNPGKILTESGELHGTLKYEADADSVEVGSPREYAAVHQFGHDPEPGHVLFRGPPIPARPFLGLSSADRDEIEAAIREHFDL